MHIMEEPIERLAGIGPVVEPGQFPIAAVGLEHGHINGMCQALIEAGASLKWVYDSDPAKVAALCRRFPGARPARSEAEVLEDPAVRLVAGAAVPSRRAALGLRVMAAGKDYFTDKAPMTSLEQLEAVRAAVGRTGRKYMVYYAERLHAESSVYAGWLIERGAVGRVIQVMGLGPHRLDAPTRPAWFFDRAQYGGILIDIGSHQIEQFLAFTGSRSAQVQLARAANYAHPQYPELEDFGDVALLGEHGEAGYFRVDWFTPDGLSTWGDGRVIVLGDQGYLELRKGVDVAAGQPGELVILVDKSGEHRRWVGGQVGCPFFGQLILDCLHRTEQAMSQRHALYAAQLSLEAQRLAVTTA